MYSVKPVFKVAEARARFGELLDDAEQGAPVVIERRGVRFRLVAESPASPAARTAGRFFDYVDPSVLSGGWTWQQGAKGLRFVPRRRR